MNFINVIVGFLVDLLVIPLRGLNPAWSLTALSLVTGLFFLMIFKWTSDQDALFNAKQRLKAHLLELLLYSNDMVLSMRAQKDLFLTNLSYIRCTLRPILFLLIPVLLLLVQLDMRYGLRPLEVGETTLLRVTLSPTVSADDLPELQLPDGVVVDAMPLRIPSKREFDWRLRATGEGDHALTIVVGRTQVSKRLRVGGPLAVLTPEVRQPSLLSTLGRPGEPPLSADSPVQAISVEYPSRDVELFGYPMHWMIFFFIMSVVPAYAVKGLFGVEV
jgi:hypothetical protein